jgi:hypothetical protein
MLSEKNKCERFYTGSGCYSAGAHRDRVSISTRAHSDRTSHVMAQMWMSLDEA